MIDYRKIDADWQNRKAGRFAIVEPQGGFIPKMPDGCSPPQSYDRINGD